MSSVRVKNYDEYLKYLKDEFGRYESIPSDSEVCSFINEYNLYNEWKITVSDVKIDICNEILHKVSIDKSSKTILSYRAYLKKLKEVFGIPDNMPDVEAIENFINEYNLGVMWGITVDDVCEDLDKIIDGQFDEIYNDSAPTSSQSTRPYNKSAIIDRESDYTTRKYSSSAPISKPSVSQSNTVKTVSRPQSYYWGIHSKAPSYKEDEAFERLLEENFKRSIEKRQAPPESKKLKKNARENKSAETILLDGDNHFDEGQKGLEDVPPSTKVRGIFSQKGAKDKFDKKHAGKPNFSSKLVKSGDQAVDNQIKAEAGRILKGENQKVKIVSQDKGYKKFADKKNKNTAGNKVTLSKSAREKGKKKSKT